MQNLLSVLPGSHTTSSTKRKTPFLTARIAHRRQYKLQNCPPVLPESRTAGSTNCKTVILYCPIRTPQAVQIAKRSLCTARITHRRQCHRRKHTNALPFHSRPSILRQCQNQSPPTALPNLPNTSTQRQCQCTIINSPLPPCTLRSNLLRPPSSHHKKKTQPPGTPGTGPNTNQSLFFKYSFILNAQKYGKVYMLFALPTLKSPSFIPYEISL